MESALEKTTKCMGMGKGLHHCNSLHDVGGCGEGTVLCAQGTSSCCRIRECLRVCICARDRRCMCDVFLCSYMCAYATVSACERASDFHIYKTPKIKVHEYCST